MKNEKKIFWIKNMYMIAGSKKRKKLDLTRDLKKPTL